MVLRPPADLIFVEFAVTVPLLRFFTAALLLYKADQMNLLRPGGTGGDTTWGDSFYKDLEAELPSYKPAGWDGVCWVHLPPLANTSVRSLSHIS